MTCCSLTARCMLPVTAGRGGATRLRPTPAARPVPARLAARICRASAAAAPAKAKQPVITLTDDALTHLVKLREESGSDALLLRIGVKSGGCSGMSYHMDFEDESNVKEEDEVMQYDGGFRLVCDPKSLLYLFGMRLDWSSALIGGGFQFQNPNAVDSCGCGKSFGV
mmetsp:Transcript_10055/g.30105  ORF Transcript_10055/g.30105 Transcript_10055/m.30105 type:complete len:167 (+) Transcript_10055:236-736(+)